MFSIVFISSRPFPPHLKRLPQEFVALQEVLAALHRPNASWSVGQTVLAARNGLSVPFESTFIVISMLFGSKT